MDVEETAAVIVDAAFHIHVRLGPGLLESVYEALLAYELMRRGCHVVRQRTFGFVYDDVTVKKGDSCSPTYVPWISRSACWSISAEPR